MNKYLQNRSEKVVIRGDFVTEHLTITSFNTSTKDVSFNSRKTTRKIVTGVVVIDENNLYGLDEKINCENIHLWEEILAEEIEDIL
jgi:hypothetical protein